jgi:hypothetical protein
LVERENPKVEEIQNSMIKIGFYDPLIALALTSSVPTVVRTKALFTLAKITFANERVQSIFARKMFKEDIPTPAVLSVIKIAIESSNINLRYAATEMIGSFLFSNSDGQISIAATLKSPKTEDGGEDVNSAGSIIIQNIFDTSKIRKDSHHIWFPTVIFSHVLRNNDLCKKICIDHLENDESLFSSLLSKLIETSSHPTLYVTTISYLTLLIVWLEEYPVGVSHFLQEGSNVQFVVELLNQNSTAHPHVQGCAAFLFAICVLFHSEAESQSFTRSALEDIIKSRVGLDVYCSRIVRLRDYISSLIAEKRRKDVQMGTYDFDDYFSELFVGYYDKICR